jgi:hypothetical protein
MANLVCWDRARIQYATQVDVGGLEVDDVRGDAVFAAIHQPIPVLRHRDVGATRSPAVTEHDVLREFAAPLTSNEPRLVFIAGEKGTGKSHLVRWLKSQLGPRPGWHVVYIEKRNTSLRRVTEKILEGITSEGAVRLRDQLARASSAIASDDEAVNALLMRLHHLVTFDGDQVIKGLPNLSPAELRDLRTKGNRLLGDFTFRAVLSQQDGPIRRIVRLALGGAEPGETIDEADLHVTEADLMVDPTVFEDLGQQLLGLVRLLVANRPLRSELAALCDHYLPRAKAEVFTGPGTNLLEVFEDVRREITSRGEELCLFIEDLVLLHGIDRQLAQALTVPASRDLCKLRAAIAVTSGYLEQMDTFKDRGVQFTLDLDLNRIGGEGLRDFIGRYLNAGRVPDESLIRRYEESREVPNACWVCPVRQECHETFGTSASGYGLYPFNRVALDRLVELASPVGFRPREILRQVIRAPLETAEDELPQAGVFPSDRFARALDDVRIKVPSSARDAVKRINPLTPDAEISIRNFYSAAPPAADQAARKIAAFLGVKLTDDQRLNFLTDDDGRPGPEPPPSPPVLNEIEAWVAGSTLSASTARAIRRWLCELVVAELTDGAYGVSVRRRSIGNSVEWFVGAHRLRMTDIDIDKAQGGRAVSPGPVSMKFGVDDANAVTFHGIIAASNGQDLDAVGNGQWFLDLLPRVSRFATELAKAGSRDREPIVKAASRVLMILRHESPVPGKTVRDAIPQMLRPDSGAARSASPDLAQFRRNVKSARQEALLALRDRVTAARGGGKPVLLDAGTCFPALRAALNERVLPESLGRSVEIPQLAAVRTSQERAAQEIGGSIAATVRRLSAVIPPDEDLATAMQLVQDLVNEAQTQVPMPVSDFRTRLLDTARAVSVSSMDSYRRLRRRPAMGPEDLWDLLDDPRPQLETLLAFAELAEQLFASVQSGLASNPTGSESLDVDAVVQEVRSLADVMDSILGGTR